MKLGETQNESYPTYFLPIIINITLSLSFTHEKINVKLVFTLFYLP